MAQGFIPPHGGYKRLKAYQKALIVYDANVYFVGRWVEPRSRTRDQMEQAARCGKQNIVEGSLASATSKQTEVHLTNVARASFGELKEDYEDFLRNRHLPIWTKDHSIAKQVTGISRQDGKSYETYRQWIEHKDPEIAANVIRHLTMQTTLLLDRQIGRLEQEFLEKGGIRERMTAARLAARDGQAVLPKPAVPSCPLCEKPMKQRTARVGPRAGQAFWGCADYPRCRRLRAMEDREPEQP